MERVDSLPSYTSRAKREGDIEGKDYIFVNKEEFEKMIENEELYEYDVHHKRILWYFKKITK